MSSFAVQRITVSACKEQSAIFVTDFFCPNDIPCKSKKFNVKKNVVLYFIVQALGITVSGLAQFLLCASTKLFNKDNDFILKLVLKAGVLSSASAGNFFRHARTGAKEKLSPLPRVSSEVAAHRFYLTIFLAIIFLRPVSCHVKRLRRSNCRKPNSVLK